MPHALPKAVRERCVRFVEAGNSCHEAARRFEVSRSFVINLMRLYWETGSVEPRPRRWALQAPLSHLGLMQQRLQRTKSDGRFVWRYFQCGS